MTEQISLARAISDALCAKIGDCNRCPFTYECYKDNPIEKMAQKVIDERKDNNE